jgi:ferredoxin--NADP+ reductase
VIGTNKKDAQETVSHLLEDLEADKIPTPPEDVEPIEALLAERAPDHVEWTDWELIDSAEQEAGKPHGRPRVKFVRIEDMLEAAAKGQPVAG